MGGAQLRPPPPTPAPPLCRQPAGSVPADARGAVAATCPRRPSPGPRRRPALPLPEPVMWTRSGRPLLEHDDRSLWERPRGLGSPGSLRRAGAAGSGASAAAGPAGSPGGSAARLPASAIGARSGRPGARGGAGALGALPARRPRGSARGGRLDAGRRAAGGEGGRRKRSENFAQEGAAYSWLSLPRSCAALGARAHAPLLLPEGPALPVAGWLPEGPRWSSPSKQPRISGVGASGAGMHGQG